MPLVVLATLKFMRHDKHIIIDSYINKPASLHLSVVKVVQLYFFINNLSLIIAK